MYNSTEIGQNVRETDGTFPRDKREDGCNLNVGCPAEFLYVFIGWFSSQLDTNVSFLALFGRPGYPGKNPGIFRHNVCFPWLSRTSELFDPHPFMWKTSENHCFISRFRPLEFRIAQLLWIFLQEGRPIEWARAVAEAKRTKLGFWVSILCVVAHFQMFQECCPIV